MGAVLDNKFDFDYQENWLENNIYQEMSLTASAFAYTWSKWNADCGKDKIIIQAVEQLEDEQPLEVNKSSLGPYLISGFSGFKHEAIGSSTHPWMVC